jgi:microcystin-dependent protein
MGTPFLSEIKIMSFNFAPKGWALCNGQTLPINQNQALFSLLGTMYGGNGQTTFGLPNLQGEVPIHIGSNFSIQGQTGGEQAHTLTQSEMPTHVHSLNGSTTTATTVSPDTNTVLSVSSPQFLYAAAANLVAMAPSSIGNTGGSQPHNNMQPYLVLNFCIALQGAFPSRN